MTVDNTSTASSRFRLFLAALIFAGAAPLGLTACESDGPAEEFGESVDETAEEAGDEMEEATE